MPATTGQFQGSTEHRLSHLSDSGPVFNQLHLTAPFLSAIPVFQHHSAPPFHVTHLYLRRGAILLDLYEYDMNMNMNTSRHLIGRRRRRRIFTLAKLGNLTTSKA